MAPNSGLGFIACGPSGLANSTGSHCEPAENFWCELRTTISREINGLSWFAEVVRTCRFPPEKKYASEGDGGPEGGGLLRFNCPPGHLRR